MTRNDINSNLIGKKVKVMVTGLMVNGIVTDFSENEYSYIIDIDHRPVNWGGEIYTHKTHLIRKSDFWGIDTIEYV